jgi:hypothetical protein
MPSRVRRNIRHLSQRQSSENSVGFLPRPGSWAGICSTTTHIPRSGLSFHSSPGGGQAFLKKHKNYSSIVLTININSHEILLLWVFHRHFSHCRETKKSFGVA